MPALPVSALDNRSRVRRQAEAANQLIKTRRVRILPIRSVTVPAVPSDFPGATSARGRVATTLHLE